MVRAARMYLNEEATPAATGYRFDVVGVTFSDDGGTPECVHIEDAFRVDG